MSKKQKKKAITKWVEINERTEEVFETRRTKYVPEAEIGAHDKGLAENRQKIALSEVPVMPVALRSRSQSF